MRSKLVSAWAGGGEKGAVQVGYARYMADKGLQFERIVGTSTGSLQGSMYALNRVDQLCKIWLDIKDNNDVYKKWFFRYLSALWRKGLYNPKPLRKIIDQEISPEQLASSNQEFISCSVNLDLKEKFYCNAKKNKIDIKDHIYSSAAFPFLFPPVTKDGFQYSDGGVAEPIPARQAGYNIEFDYMIICLTSPRETQAKPKSSWFSKSIAGQALKTIDSMMTEIYQNDLKTGLENYWKSKRMIILEPSEEELKKYSPGTMQFNPKYIREGIKIGYEIAERELSKIL